MDVHSLQKALPRQEASITPTSFHAEVEGFRKTIADAALTVEEKRRALGVIVEHAGMVDPHVNGYEGVGVSLKEALLSWLDFRLAPLH